MQPLVVTQVTTVPTPFCANAIQQEAKLSKSQEQKSSEDSEVAARLWRYFKETRFLQGTFREILIDPYTISLSKKHNRGLVQVFKRSQLNPKNPDHWKYLLSMLAAALYPPSPHEEAQLTERKHKWTDENIRLCFVEVAETCLSSNQPAAKVLEGMTPDRLEKMKLEQPARYESLKHLRYLSDRGRQNWFSNWRSAARDACRSRRRLSWFGTDNKVCHLVEKLEKAALQGKKSQS